MTCRALMALPRQRLVRRFSSSPKCTQVPGYRFGSSGQYSESFRPHCWSPLVGLGVLLGAWFSCVAEGAVRGRDVPLLGWM